MSLDTGTELWMLGVNGFGVVFYLVSLYYSKILSKGGSNDELKEMSNKE
ncbi:hypothetical protein MED121_04158 [Marinomonas sp. MED121]|nr:hypothetical protein [Marinomonas sp. MED121]EAQ63935.1 hypothetical protein MED121_04158 [Marinomonas sp. MED121]